MESFNDVFAEIVGADELEEGAPGSSYKADGKIHEQQRDVLKRLKDGDIRIACIGFENQSAPDPDMPLRVIGYDGAEYQAQTRRKDGERYPVITLVLYFNYERPWTGPLHLKDRLTISKRFEPFVNDYKVHLIQIADLPPEIVKLFRSDFRAVVEFFVQKKRNGDYKPEPRVLDHMQETLQLLSVMTKDHRILDAYQPDDPQGVPRTMCDVIDRIENRGIDKGIGIGIAKGREEGIDIGIAKGRKEALDEGRQEGREEGIDEMALLIEKLVDQNRFEDVKKVSKDKEYRMQLLKQFALI